MADTYRCKQCGYAAAGTPGAKPNLCPECGGNQLALIEPERPPVEPEAPPAAPETPGEAE